MGQKKDTIKIQCKVCKGNTNHNLEWKKETNWEDKESGIQGQVNHQVLVCCGCSEITYRTISMDSEDFEIVGEELCVRNLSF